MTRREVLSVTIVALALSGLSTVAQANPQASGFDWADRSTGTDEQFRGLSALGDRTAWISGEKGGVMRTSDGGRTWKDVSPKTARTDELALRDIQAWDSRTAVALSIGPGEDSRIFRTDNGGKTWRETFRNTDESAFFNCIAFNRNGTGLAVSDPVDGKFRILRSTNKGKSWKVLPTKGMPAAIDPEFNFAASGTCLVSAAQQSGRTKDNFWMVSGGVSPRVFHTKDAGNTWAAHTTQIRGGEAAGIYSAAFKNSREGVIVGGDYTAAEDGSDAAATSRDGGSTWTLSRKPVGGYRSGVAYDPRNGRTLLAVGPTGSDVSRDGGQTWRTFDTTAYDGVQCTKRGACWASGPNGAVGVLKRR
ncbi:oxidoreductase [Demetria terragena]|uniref:oxidoreductase n=1 Tax=Demetria terragena TaxID=63959 RepID=UPI00039D8CDF|nr:oxidoreductase [Demetria terragena]